MSFYKNQADEQTAQRTDIAVYMDITGMSGAEPTGEGDHVYTKCGTAWTSFTENPGAQTKQRKFINEKTERNNITRYAPQWAFECLLMYNRPDIKKIYDIIKKRKTGKDTVVTLIVVDLFETSGDGYSARMLNASVQVSSLDDDDDMIIKGTFYNQGDEVLGSFNTETGVFTADEANNAEAAAADNGGTSDTTTEESGS